MKYRILSLPLAVLFMFFMVLSVTSCQKEQSQNGTDEQQEMEASKNSGEADGEAEIVFNGVFDDVMGVNDEVGMSGTGIFGRVTACPDVTVTRLNPPDPFPVRVTLDFGTGCVGRDGHFRKGKIVTVYTNRLIVPGAVATTEFVNFFFDSVSVQGVHKVTNTSSPVANTPPARQYKVEAINAKLTRPNGNFTEWNSLKVITQVEGFATPAPLDDIFRIEGNANGRVKRGALLVAWQSTIIEPLMKRFNCRWIVRGKVRIVRLNLSANSPWIGVLDFGNGDCDNRATITVNGVTHQITLP
ncbi:MAG TPA: hypothetical protein VFV31_10620 [Chitinophagaceae bacterium]|nr:hypothetical protein [Chitinophagaceae bacterium]